MAEQYVKTERRRARRRTIGRGETRRRVAESAVDSPLGGEEDRRHRVAPMARRKSRDSDSIRRSRPRRRCVPATVTMVSASAATSSVPPSRAGDAQRMRLAVPTGSRPSARRPRAPQCLMVDQPRRRLTSACLAILRIWIEPGRRRHRREPSSSASSTSIGWTISMSATVITLPGRLGRRSRLSLAPGHSSGVQYVGMLYGEEQRAALPGDQRGLEGYEWLQWHARSCC